MNRKTANVVNLWTISALLMLAAACGKSSHPKQESTVAPPSARPSVPDLKVSAAARARIADPKPGAQSKKKPVADSFGKGRSVITVKDHPGGINHSFWSEEMEMDGSGQPVLVDVAWDNSHKVLYLSRESSFACRNGQAADGSVLTAIYGAGNTLNRSTGSGWWVAELDEGECGVRAAGLYGCKFNADGLNTECGWAVIADAYDDVWIVPLPEPQGEAPSGSGTGN